MRVKNRRIYLTVFTILVLLLFTYVKLNFIYTPFFYPNKNQNSFRWYKFKNPIDIEGHCWTESGEQIIYRPIRNDEKKARYIIDNFDKMQIIENLDNDRYISPLPSERGREYTVIIRRASSENESRRSAGPILLQFSFYENNDIAQQDGVRFYKISDEYKRYIISLLSDITQDK